VVAARLNMFSSVDYWAQFDGSAPAEQPPQPEVVISDHFSHSGEAGTPGAFFSTVELVHGLLLFTLELVALLWSSQPMTRRSAHRTKRKAMRAPALWTTAMLPAQPLRFVRLCSEEAM